MLEEQAVALAAEFATDSHKAHLAKLADEASINPILLNRILSLRQVLHGYIMADYNRRGYANKVDAEEMKNLHRQILQAIQTGKQDDAKQAMHSYFQNAAGWQLTQAE